MVSLAWRPIFPFLMEKRVESGASSGLKPEKTMKIWNVIKMDLLVVFYTPSLVRGNI